MPPSWYTVGHHGWWLCNLKLQALEQPLAPMVGRWWYYFEGAHMKVRNICVCIHFKQINIMCNICICVCVRLHVLQSDAFYFLGKVRQAWVHTVYIYILCICTLWQCISIRNMGQTATRSSKTGGFQCPKQCPSNPANSWNPAGTAVFQVLATCQTAGSNVVK